MRTARTLILLLAMIGASQVLFAPAPASAVTVGQLATGSPPAVSCPSGQYDLAQYSSSVSYAVPYSYGTNAMVTSWSTNAAAPAGQTVTFKVFRQNPSDATIWLVVGHDGPRTLGPGVNTFPTQIQASGGDVIGFNTGNAATVGHACWFSFAENAAYFQRAGDLADGLEGAFSIPSYQRRLNVTAEVADLPDPPEAVPSNAFHFGRLTRNAKKGTATLTVVLEQPGSGELDLAATKNVKGAQAGPPRIKGQGRALSEIELPVVPRGKAKKQLTQTGKVTVNVRVTWTPDEGNPNTQSLKVALRKRV